MRNKSSFSPFANGGVEIKATCGIIPSAGVFHRKGTPRPDIGDQRIDYLTGYDWKAHHRLTNNLLALLWDFIDGRAHIVAVFFGANLTQQDWGAIVTPRAGGGRTTSVSIMNASGINKLYNNWLLVIDDQRYIRFLNTKNNGTAIR